MSNCLSIKPSPAAVIVSRNQPDKEDQLEPAQQYQRHHNKTIISQAILPLRV
jgi:hypothetical protein